jgi:hypothetical protein
MTLHLARSDPKHPESPAGTERDTDIRFVDSPTFVFVSRARAGDALPTYSEGNLRLSRERRLFRSRVVFSPLLRKRGLSVLSVSFRFVYENKGKAVCGERGPPRTKKSWDWSDLTKVTG